MGQHVSDSIDFFLNGRLKWQRSETATVMKGCGVEPSFPDELSRRSEKFGAVFQADIYGGARNPFDVFLEVNLLI